jgi:hypothetical protein
VYDSSGELYNGGEMTDLRVVHRKSRAGHDQTVATGGFRAG